MNTNKTNNKSVGICLGWLPQSSSHAHGWRQNNMLQQLFYELAIKLQQELLGRFSYKWVWFGIYLQLHFVMSHNTLGTHSLFPHYYCILKKRGCHISPPALDSAMSTSLGLCTHTLLEFWDYNFFWLQSYSSNVAIMLIASVPMVKSDYTCLSY